MKMVLFSLSLLVLFCACTNDQEKKEKSKVEQFTDRTAEKAVNYIKTPLDKAQKTVDAANQRNKAIREVKKQSR